jgi:hypothetical protein
VPTSSRLISLAQDRVSSFLYWIKWFLLWKILNSIVQKIVEYDLPESIRDKSRNLVISFTKRIFQSAVPVSMTIFYNSKKCEDQILIADANMKFKIFDKNTFEILATFMGPIYDSYVKQFVSSQPCLYKNIFPHSNLCGLSHSYNLKNKKF